MQHKLNVALKTAIYASRRKQKRIAALARVSEQHLSHIVSGRREATKEEKDRLAKVLQTPVEEIFPSEALAS